MKKLTYEECITALAEMQGEEIIRTYKDPSDLLTGEGDGSAENQLRADLEGVTRDLQERIEEYLSENLADEIEDEDDTTNPEEV